MKIVYTVWGSEDGLVAVVSSVQKAMGVAREYLSVAPGQLYTGKTKATVELLRGIFRNEHMLGLLLHRKGQTGLGASHVKVTVVEVNTRRDGESI